MAQICDTNCTSISNISYTGFEELKRKSACCLSNKLTQCSRVLLEKPFLSQLVNKFATNHGTRGFQVWGLPLRFETSYIFTEGVVSPSPIIHAGGPLFVGCLPLPVLYIGSYSPYLKAVSPTATWVHAMSWRRPILSLLLRYWVFNKQKLWNGSWTYTQ
jgi:hypothetical protein